jgi:hypothetical protein
MVLRKSFELLIAEEALAPGDFHALWEKWKSDESDGNRPYGISALQFERRWNETETSTRANFQVDF